MYVCLKCSSTNSQICSWSNDVQSTLSAVVGCNAILLWITKPAELWGTILLRSGPSTRCTLVPSEYVPVYAVSSLLRISQDIVRLEILRLKILIVVKDKKTRNLFSKQLRYNWKKNQCFITWTLALSKKDVRWNFLCRPDHPMRIFV